MALACWSSLPTRSSRTAKTSVRCTRGSRAGTAAVLVPAMVAPAADALSRSIDHQGPAGCCSRLPAHLRRVELRGQQQPIWWNRVAWGQRLGLCDALWAVDVEGCQRCHEKVITSVQLALQTCCGGSASFEMNQTTNLCEASRFLTCPAAGDRQMRGSGCDVVHLYMLSHRLFAIARH